MTRLFLSLIPTLVFANLAVCEENYTYWIDETCRRFGSRIPNAIDEALSNAGAAVSRLISNDSLQHEYFQLVFSPPGQPGQPQYEETVRKVSSK